MRIESIKLNTREKAERIYKLLGVRGIDILTIEYRGEILGYYLSYFVREK